MYTKAQFAKMLDHTLLRPTASKSDILRICDEAKKHHFCAVVVFPYWIPFVAKQLSGTDIKTCSVVDFPFGAGGIHAKLCEARHATNEGARELDVVMNISAFKSGDDAIVRRECHIVVDAVKMTGITQSDHRVLVKVIIETAYLSEEEIKRASEIVRDSGADFVKTSTGTASSGATPEIVRAIRRVVGPGIGVKAAGGIRTVEQAMAMLDAGANRIGTSSAVAIASAFDPHNYMAG